MAKNRTMRVAVLMLALTLITSCFVGGTFAKYVTEGTASDSARVAKWGVAVFANENGSVFANEYDASGDATGIVVKADEKVVAPGTSSDEVNNTLYFGVTGTPEVATKITTEFTGKDIYVGDYHPLTFTLSILDNNAEIADPAAADWSQATTVTGTFAEIQTAISNYASFNCAAGETLDALFKIEWKWAFEQTDEGGNSMNANDTLLGDIAAGATTTVENNIALSYSVKVIVEQVN